MGLNVNQREFPQWVPNPTSLSLLTGKTYDLEPLLGQLLGCVQARCAALKAGADPTDEYLARLMHLNVPARYVYQEEEIMATITGVDAYGRLQLSVADGRRLACAMKEIKYCI